MKKFLCIFFALFTLTLTGCGGEKKVYSAEDYEFCYDSAKWEFYHKYDNGDIWFTHKQNAAYFVVSVVPITGFDDASEIDINEEFEMSKEIHSHLTDNDFEMEIINRDGQNWIRIEESGGFTQYTGNKGKNSYSISFTPHMPPHEDYTKSQKDFEEVFDSFKITE